MKRWKIDYYLTFSGHEPVREFIDDLELKAKARAYNTFELLAELGVNLKFPHAKKVTGTPLWELRILGDVSLRFFYVVKMGQSFLILHGFSKRKQKTPKNEIKTAMERLKDYKRRT